MLAADLAGRRMYGRMSAAVRLGPLGKGDVLWYTAAGQGTNLVQDVAAELLHHIRHMLAAVVLGPGKGCGLLWDIVAELDRLQRRARVWDIAAQSGLPAPPLLELLYIGSWAYVS